MKEFLKKYWQYLLNIYLFCWFFGWVSWQTYQYGDKGQLGYVEISFTIQSIILAVLILVRRPHQAVKYHVGHQMVALAAFVSGAGFMGQPPTGGAIVQGIAQGIIFLANIIGVVTLLNLGRSFGILIAFRKLQNKGLYGVVRHPMYGTDILLRLGFLISHFTLSTIVLFIVSSACYVYRAILEERFLLQQTEYKEYKQTVKYRFIPFVF